MYGIVESEKSFAQAAALSPDPQLAIIAAEVEKKTRLMVDEAKWAGRK